MEKKHFIEQESGLWIQLKELGLSPVFSIFLAGVKIRKTRPVGGFNLAGKWAKKLKGVEPKEAWFILTNLGNLPKAITAYKKRFGIEEM